MQEFVWLNDALIPLDQARVSVNDRGFLYGDGLFETLRAEAGTIYFLRSTWPAWRPRPGFFGWPCRQAFPGRNA